MSRPKGSKNGIRLPSYKSKKTIWAIIRDDNNVRARLYSYLMKLARRDDITLSEYAELANYTFDRIGRYYTTKEKEAA